MSPAIGPARASASWGFMVPWGTGSRRSRVRETKRMDTMQELDTELSELQERYALIRGHL